MLGGAADLDAAILEAVERGSSRDTNLERGTPFGALLRGFRQVAGLTQEELAIEAGLSPDAVSALERGHRKRPYPHTVRSLADALGLSEHENAALLAAVPKRGGASAAPDVGSEPALLGPPTPLVGRERNAEEAVALLRRPEVRLLTLVGPGGVGKTRLAIRVARDGVAFFRDGAVFVELEAVVDPKRVTTSVASAFGLPDAWDRPLFDRLREYLRGKEMLLVLDNFEQVRSAAPGLVRLLPGCPGLKMLVTSRSPLGVRAEQQLEVPPLATPDPACGLDPTPIASSPAVALFVERAQAVDSSFGLTDKNAWAVAEICRRLDGLPLAIELVASRTKLLIPEALLARLTPGLGMLAGGGADLPERQRTMRRTIDWSHDLLGESEKRLFRRLSVFSGGCTLEAAEAVCAEPGSSIDVLDALSSLVDASLLRRERGEEPEPRFKMLVVVQEYARERLAESGEAAAMREQHAGHFLGLAEAAKPRLLGPEGAAWLERLEHDHDNLREVLRWAQETGAVEAGLRLAGELSWFWWIRGHLSEGRRWAEGFISKDPDGGQAEASAMARYAAGELAFGQGDLGRATELLEEALALYRELDDEVGIATVLVEFGQVSRTRGNEERAAALSEEGLALGRKLEQHAVAAIALNTLGLLERRRGDVEGAAARHEEALTLFREAGEGWGAAYALSNLGSLALEGGQAERAEALLEESLSLYEGLRDRAGRAYVLTSLGDVARERGARERATDLYEEALLLHRELGNERGAARALARLAIGQ